MARRGRGIADDDDVRTDERPSRMLRAPPVYERRTPDPLAARSILLAQQAVRPVFFRASKENKQSPFAGFSQNGSDSCRLVEANL